MVFRRRPPASRPSRFAPFRHGRFGLFFATYSISLFGTSMAAVALSFGVLENNGSAADLGYVNAARIVPMVLFLLGGGVVGDWLPRRWVMLTADCIRTVSQASIALLFALGHAPLWALLLLAATGGLSEAFFNPALSGMIPTLAPKDQLQEANALLSLSRSATNVAGPALAGVLVAVVGAQTVLAIDAASYAVSVVGLLLLRLPTPALRPRPSMITQLREGWTIFRSRTWLWIVTVQFSLFNLIVWAPYLILGPVTAYRSYGGASAWGAIMAGYGAGSILGGLALLGRRPARPLLVAVAATFLWAAPSACLLLGTPVAVVVVGAACAGTASAVFNTLWSTTMQQQIPAEALSRISSYVSLGAYAAGPLGFAIAGPIAQLVGTAPVLAVGVGWQLVASAVVLALPAIRAVRQPAKLGESAAVGV
ncbi:MFS transporter [Nocardia sp. NPDC060256]|uniref:MFS transporter n=1 Tax=unclassified Nocardia TaxID=2637762 RepID=UPI003649C582